MSFATDKIENYCDEYLFTEKLCSELSSVSQNLFHLLSDLNKPPDYLDLEPEINRLQRETRILVSHISFMILNQNNSCQAVAELGAEIEEIREKYCKLQVERDNQQERIEEMQLEINKLECQLQQQSQFCASLGAIVGNLLWKCSRLPDVVTMMLSVNKIPDFLGLVSGTLIPFLETYDTEMPTSDTDEAQFIMSLCGTVTNIAAASEGRNFLSTNSKGQELIANIVRLLPVIPGPSGNYLKRLLLMTLFNVSINQSGLVFLQEDNNAAKVLAYCLENDNSPELRRMALKVILSITYDIKSVSILKEFEKTLPMSFIENMTQSSDLETKAVAEEVLGNLIRARMQLIPDD